jgi:hypothetical protein
MSHRVGIAGVIEVAARRCENSEPVESELTQVDPLPVSGSIELGRREDSDVAAAEDELAIVERPARVHAAALRAGVAHLDVADHGAPPYGRATCPAVSPLISTSVPAALQRFARR